MTNRDKEAELDYQWRVYAGFWKIVGKHSKHWQYSKFETIEKLQAWIDQAKAEAVLEELAKLAEQWKPYLFGVNNGDDYASENGVPLEVIHDRIDQLKSKGA